jgi:hypothetical protein
MLIDFRDRRQSGKPRSDDFLATSLARSAVGRLIE